MRAPAPLLTAALSTLLVATAWLIPAAARAEVRTVRVERPRCGELPFAHERLVELVAVELALHRVALVDGPADAVVRYDAVECGRGARLALAVEHAGATPTEFEVSGLTARALALLLAELLRAQPDPAVEAPTEPEPQPSSSRDATEGAPDVPEAAMVEVAVDTVLAGESGLEEQSEAVRPTVGSDDGRAAGLAEVLGAPAIDRDPVPSRSLEDVSIVFGALGIGPLYHPSSRAWLLVLRAEVGLRMPFWRPLAVHLDLSYGQGRSEWAIHMGAAGVGLWLGVTVGGPDLALELGPRLAIQGAWAFELPHREIFPGNDYQLTVTGLARGTLRLHGAASLLLDLELGATALGGVDFFSTDPANSFGGGLSGVVLGTRIGILLD